MWVGGGPALVRPLTMLLCGDKNKQITLNKSVIKCEHEQPSLLSQTVVLNVCICRQARVCVGRAGGGRPCVTNARGEKYKI